MTNRDDLKKKIEEEEKMSSGEGTLGSGSADLEADVDTKEALEEIEGHELLTGEEDEDLEE